MQPDDKRYLLKHVPACLAAGAFITLAYAPFDLPFIAIVSMAVLFHSWSKGSARGAFITGYLFGLGMFGCGLYWLHISINLFGGINLPAACLLTFLLVAFLALYPALTGYIARRITDQPAVLLLLVFPSLWPLSEWLRGWLFSGFPWLTLGYSQIDTPLAGFAPVLGVYAVSWITCLSAGLLVLLIAAGMKTRIAIVMVLLIIGSTAYTLSAVSWTKPAPETRSVALVQGAIPQSLKWKPEQRQKTVNLYVSLTMPHWQSSDLIIWPETAIPLFYHQARPLVDALQSKAVKSRAELLSGFAFRDNRNNQTYNSLVSIGESKNIYYKRHLVPFGEYLPLDRLLRPLLNLLSIPMSDFSAGSDRPLLKVAGLTAGVSICFEDVFGEEIIDALPEADLLINVSNDAWFGDSLAPHQHLQMARMRARETGRYLLRATNTGISAIIDEQGRVISRSPQFRPDVLTGTARLFTGLTPYARLGNRPIVILLILLAGLAIGMHRAGRKTGNST